MWSSFWKEFNSENDWRFPDMPPSQLEELLDDPSMDDSERVRADWMWRRRPKPAFGEEFLGYCLVLAVGTSLPLIHEIGLFLDLV